MKKLLTLLLALPLLWGHAAAQENAKYTILLTGASFASPQNGWFEIGCRQLDARAINRAIGGESIADTANRMAEGTLWNAGELDAQNYLLLLGNTELDPQRELGYLAAMQRNHVAGIILLGSYYSPQLALALKNCRVPVVVTGQRFPEVACVYNDDRSAARELAQRMLEHGRRHIVYIGGTERDQATGVQRREGVQDALNAAGLDGDALPRICCTAFTMEEGERCMKELLACCPALDGVVCVTDTVAFGAMRALKQAGRKIGADVSLAGIGDSWAGSMTEPGLTTVQFYQKQVGEEAARMLLQMLEEKEPGGPVRQVTLSYRVVERGSI